MSWLAQHGVCNSYERYQRLPGIVLNDCRMIMAAEAAHSDTTQPSQNLLEAEGIA